MPPVANANYAWILHMISKLDVSDGRAGFLLANGALNASADEYQIRKEIIERDYVEAIIVLPREYVLYNRYLCNPMDTQYEQECQRVR